MIIDDEVELPNSGERSLKTERAPSSCLCHASCQFNYNVAILDLYGVHAVCKQKPYQAHAIAPLAVWLQ